MNPRCLRHRLEKAAKILVTIQKHLPSADCALDAEKGENGHIQISFVNNPVSPNKFKALGEDLESKGYIFTEKLLPWIGQVSFKGKAADMPSVVMTLPAMQDRLQITLETPVRPYTFAKAG
jgi:hypothetical protein